MISIIKETKKKSTKKKNKRINWLNSQLKQARMRQNFVQFNLFFQNLTDIEFKNLFLDDVFKNIKPVNFLLLSNFIFGFFLFITSFSLPTSIEKTMVMTALGCLLFFLKIVEFVAFREIFQGRGKNKEVKVKVDESQLTPIKIKSN